MIDMLLLTRFKILLRRKETLFWIILFPILLASAEYLAFGKFIHSTPIETIELGCIEEEPVNPYLTSVFEEAVLEDDQKLYHITYYATKKEGLEALEDKEIMILASEQNGNVSLDVNENSSAITVTKSLIEQFQLIQDMVVKTGEDPKVISEHLLSENSYIMDLSNQKNATFFTVYFYSLMAMACLYAAFFGLSIIADIRADRSNLGIRISASVVPKWKLILVNFSAAMVLELLSSMILYVYLAFILKVSLGNHIGLILLTLMLGGLAGLSIGMLLASCIKNEKKCEGVLTTLTLSLCVFAGLMSVDVKHFVDQYASFINYINPASLITNSLYALYYYDTFTNYWLYTGLLAGFSLLVIGIVLFKTRGEKYASL